jgi:hypothetical protein
MMLPYLHVIKRLYNLLKSLILWKFHPHLWSMTIPMFTHVVHKWIKSELRMNQIDS